MSEGVYKDDMKSGTCKEYKENGEIQGIGNYKNDKDDGIFQVFYKNGELKSEGILKEGILQSQNFGMKTVMKLNVNRPSCNTSILVK